MGRRHRHRRPSGQRNVGPDLSLGGLARTEDDGDAEWAVRTVTGTAAVKTYRCPGCDHEILPGVPHLVTWPLDAYGGAEERRHWHTGCWRGRATRGLSRRWS